MDSNLVVRRFKEASSLTGIQSRVAVQLGVSATHVREVALGRRTSSRVMKALLAELRHVERKEAKQLERGGAVLA